MGNKRMGDERMMRGCDVRRNVIRGCVRRGYDMRGCVMRRWVMMIYICQQKASTDYITMIRRFLCTLTSPNPGDVASITPP